MSLSPWTPTRCLFVTVALAALACGGKSGSGSDDDDSGDNTSGNVTSSSDGSGDAGGGPGSTDSGGTSASGGSNAGTNGSGGNSGNSGDTSSAGGSGGDTTSAGDTGNSGGTTAGGSGGDGGSGGGDPVPPPDLVEGCQATCDAEVAAECPSGPTATSCADGCDLTTRVPACADELERLFDCVAEDDTTSCSNEGEVVFDECVNEQLAAYACVLQEAPDPELEEPCESYCSAAVEAMCENDGGDLAGCILYCQSIGTTFPSCRPDWQDALTCGESSEFECNASGDAEPVDCDVEVLLFYACICESDPAVCR